MISSKSTVSSYSVGEARGSGAQARITSTSERTQLSFLAEDEGGRLALHLSCDPLPFCWRPARMGIKRGSFALPSCQVFVCWPQPREGLDYVRLSSLPVSECLLRG